MVLVEAQSCAKPVIAGDSGGTAETMIIEETGFIINCMKPEVIAKKIKELLQNTAQCKTMGEAGRAHAVRKLDWKVHTEKAKKLF
jgi:phosphatidylinositol alpha-1,6-mannosyltransferase